MVEQYNCMTSFTIVEIRQFTSYTAWTLLNLVMIILCGSDSDIWDLLSQYHGDILKPISQDYL